jgi:Putative zinc-finger
MMLTCKQASELLSQSLDRPLTWGERFRLRFHLLICKFCKRFWQQIFELRDAIRYQVKQTEQNEEIKLSKNVMKRIIQSINSIHH